MPERTVRAAVAQHDMEISVRITRDAPWLELWQQAGRIIAAAEREEGADD